MQYLGNEDGFYTFSLGVYADPALTAPIDDGSAVDSGEPVYVKITLHNDNKVTMHVSSCQALSTDNMMSQPFLTDG